jgi:NAD dependent epimerase/dehydratase family enzyme
MPWIHRADVAGAYLAALDGGEEWSGAINLSAPRPVTNKTFSRALGRALHRPAIAPVPKLALKLLYGEMSTIVTSGVNMVPRRLDELGYAYRHPELDEALADVLGKR